MIKVVNIYILICSLVWFAFLKREVSCKFRRWNEAMLVLDEILTANLLTDERMTNKELSSDVNWQSLAKDNDPAVGDMSSSECKAAIKLPR